MKILDNLFNDVKLKWNPFGITWDGSYGWKVQGKRSGSHIPGSDLDWGSEAGYPCLWSNPTVMLCLGYIFDKVIQPRVQVIYEDDKGLLQPVPKHPLTQLLLDPNPNYNGNALLQGLALSYRCDGNAYAHKVRSGSKVIGLEYMPHWQVLPCIDNSGIIIGYSYNRTISTGNTKTESYIKEDVIHIKDGLDPSCPYLGISRLKSQYRGIVSDGEIDTTTAVILKNRGNLGIVISPQDSSIDIDENTWQDFLRKIRNSSQGDARGSIIGSHMPIKIDRTTQSPQDLQLASIGERPRSEICSCFGIDPAALGFVATDKGGQYGSRVREARSLSYETCIIPTLCAIAESLTYQLLPDFPSVSLSPVSSKHRFISTPNIVSKAKSSDDVTIYLRVAFDYAGIKELADDDVILTSIATERFKSNIITLDEARSILGLMADPVDSRGTKYQYELIPSTGTQLPEEPGNPDENEETQGTIAQ